jgi:hypothetical protein
MAAETAESSCRALARALHDLSIAAEDLAYTLDEGASVIRTSSLALLQSYESDAAVQDRDHKYGRRTELYGGDVKHEIEGNGIAEAEGSYRGPEMEGDSPSTQRSELSKPGIASEMESPVVFHHRGIHELG